MPWPQGWLPGSFRGVQFFVDSTQLEGGRRIVSYPYPQQDNTGTEDEGRKQRKYLFEVYVLQPMGGVKTTDTVVTLAKKLITALEQSGTGTLVHPFLGNLQVRIETYTVNTRWQESGKIRFSIHYLEAGSPISPTATPDTQSAVTAAAAGALAAVQQDFSNTMMLAGKAAWLATAATNKLNQLTTAMNSLAQLATLPSSVTSLVTAAQAFSSGLTGLISTPSDLAASVVGLVELVPSLVSQPIDALSLYQDGLFGFGEQDPPLTTTQQAQVQNVTNNPVATSSIVAQLRLGGVSPSMFQKQVNNQAINTLVVAAALIGYAQTASSIPAQSDVSSPSAANAPGSTPEDSVIVVGSSAPSGTYGYDSSDAAEAALQTFLDALDLLLPFLPDASYAAMVDLSAALTLDLQTRAAALPSLISYTPPTTMPALLIAQELYGDATRADEICRRNDIMDPNFVPGGQPLEVLNA